MALAPIFKKAYWSLGFLVLFYFGSLTVLVNEWAQRQAIYAHNVRSLSLQAPNKPELFGFLRKQVQPFYIHTPDGEKLYGWHVLPLTLYAKHEAALLAQPDGPIDITDGKALPLSFKLLMEDPDACLVINFHGNAGTIAQGWRTDTYRSLASVAGDKIHVLTVDYRGFGYSTGSPSEEGLITDGVAVVKWAVNMLGISPERIVLVGQSLGTAVTVAVAERLVTDQIAVRNIILVAAFTNMRSLLRVYKIGAAIPVLAPLNPYPRLQSFFLNQLKDTWRTDFRLDRLIRKSTELNLYLIHAMNDHEIPCQQSDALFTVAANATSDRGLTSQQIYATKVHRDYSDGGFMNTWVTRSSSGGRKYIRQEVVPYGGN